MTIAYHERLRHGELNYIAAERNETETYGLICKNGSKWNAIYYDEAKQEWVSLPSFRTIDEAKDSLEKTL